MSVRIVPPPGDPTLVARHRPDETVLDASRWFWARVADPAALAAQVPGLDPPWCLTAAAAADGLAEPDGVTTRLRALGAAARIASHDDPGLRISLDDLHLTAGS